MGQNIYCIVRAAHVLGTMEVAILWN